MLGTRTIELSVEALGTLQIYQELKKYLPTARTVQLVYKQEDREFITENLSLDWLDAVNSHDFYVWFEQKKMQKQKYNVKNYELLLKIQ